LTSTRRASEDHHFELNEEYLKESDVPIKQTANTPGKKLTRRITILGANARAEADLLLP
jgi:hypothetical protein